MSPTAEQYSKMKAEEIVKKALEGKCDELDKVIDVTRDKIGIKMAEREGVAVFPAGFVIDTKEGIQSLHPVFRCESSDEPIYYVAAGYHFDETVRSITIDGIEQGSRDIEDCKNITIQWVPKLPNSIAQYSRGYLTVDVNKKLLTTAGNNSGFGLIGDWKGADSHNLDTLNKSICQKTLMVLALARAGGIKAEDTDSEFPDLQKELVKISELLC